MKKITKGLGKNFGHVKLDREDIMELIGILNQCRDDPEITNHKYDKISIEVNDFKLDSEEELKTFSDKKINHIQISFYSDSGTSFIIEVEKSGATIYLNNNSPFSLGIYKQVFDILSNRKRKFQWSGNLIYFSSGFIVVPAILETLKIGSVAYYIGLIFSVVIILAFLLFIIGMPFRKNILSLSDPKKSFWSRNIDQLGMGIIGAIIGGVITIITTIILFNLGILK
jgi:hypothetical protein